MKFNEVLLKWYDENQRDLPWRNTDNPYVIWIAEVVFQQTRISQGLPFFLEFIKTFPTVADLAASKEELVLKKWQGLGYYSRARNLHFSAKYVVTELGGEMPRTYKDLLLLKGVGPYIAAEVASVCYGEVVAAVDGNVQRVLSRYFGVSEAVNGSQGAKIIQALATENISAARPGDFNQALMDLGSSICSPKKVQCDRCVLQENCVALRMGQVAVLPVKDKKVKVRDRYFNFFIVDGAPTVSLEKRGAGDVWQGLYQLPLMESDKILDGLDAFDKKDFYRLYSTKRILSHQRIWISFWVVNALPIAFEEKEFVQVLPSELEKYPVSKSLEQLFYSNEFISLFNRVD
jgi:A/G-specific adenine glycosylase